MKKIYVITFLTTTIISTTTCMEIELTPTQTKKSVNPKEKQPLLHILNSVTPDQEIIEKLYNKVLDLPGKNVDHLIQLIEHMNNAKTEHNIHEDMMAQYSYDKWLAEKEKDYSLSRAILTFLYIKNYNRTSKENIPKYRDIIKKDEHIGNELAYSLGLLSPKNTCTLNGAYDSDFTADHYPAFHTLHNSIRSITVNHPKFEILKNFIHYIYSDYPRLQNAFLGLYYYDELKNAFYKRACYIVSNKYIWQVSDLYYLIEIVEAGKELHPPKQEYDFKNEAKNKKINILCHLIKQYNDQRKTKETPTPQQQKTYKCGIPIFKFSLPDTFDSTLFNKEIYAFKEFNELVHKFSLLRSSSDENVQECINQIYASKG